MLRKPQRGQEAEPTFCGDLDMETGDWGLMFLAEEPADKDEMREEEKWGGGGLETRALSNQATVFAPVR